MLAVFRHKFLAKLLKPPLLYRLADILHQITVEVEVMIGSEPRREYFIALIQMPQVCG